MTTADGSRITKFTGSQQGPAFMLSLKLDSGTKVDIDLVAAFSFEPQSFQKFPGKWLILDNATRQFLNPMIYPLHRLKLNTKTQKKICRLNENLTTFIYTLTGATSKQKEKKKFSLLKCIQKSNVFKKK